MRKTEILQTEKAIALIKQTFADQLCNALNLHSISSPMLVNDNNGINDDLSGVERAVSFPVKFLENNAVIVHSLAKWKRIRLEEIGMDVHEGILTDMRAIRAHEDYSPVHSIYVDQWDWELRIDRSNRCLSYLKTIVRKIYEAMQNTALKLEQELEIPHQLPPAISFIHAEQLLQLYPNLSPKEREYEITKQHKAVFIIGVGATLSDGKPHDNRASDYDDWTTISEENYQGLNGDLLVWNTILEQPLELSSMGIRVDKATLEHQLKLTSTTDRSNLYYHQLLLNDKLPLSIGGGIGQSRLCMYLLGKQHIGEVQASLWPTSVIEEFKNKGVHLL